MTHALNCADAGAVASNPAHPIRQNRATRSLPLYDAELNISPILLLDHVTRSVNASVPQNWTRAYKGPTFRPSFIYVRSARTRVRALQSLSVHAVWSDNRIQAYSTKSRPVFGSG
jgi:hypothetical protein